MNKAMLFNPAQPEPAPEDRNLPYLSQLLDSAIMIEVIRSHVFGGFLQRPVIRQCQVQRIKFKPQKNCLVVYELLTHHPVNARQERLLVTCRTYERGGSRRRYHKALLENNGQPSRYPAVFHVPELEIVGWVFPCERKIRSLPFVNNAHFLKHVLIAPLVRWTWGNDWVIRKVSSSVIHYVPEHTCTVKVECSLTNKHSHAFLHKTLFGKCYYDDQGARTYGVMAKLAQYSSQGSTALEFPEPLFYDQERRILWQQGLIGETLRDTGISQSGGSKLLTLAARAIAQFHHLPTDIAMPKSELSAVLVSLKHRQQVLSQIRDVDQTKQQWLVNHLCQTAKDLTPCQAVMLHGDVHSQNLFLQENSIAFIDLDNVAMGPPLLDLASWIGGMIYWASLNHRSVEQWLPELRRFVTEYAEHAPWPINRFDLDWYIAATLVNERLFRCVTRLKSGRLPVVNQLLNIAEEFVKHQHPLLP